MSHKSNSGGGGLLDGCRGVRLSEGLFEMMGPSKHASDAGFNACKSCLGD